VFPLQHGLRERVAVLRYASFHFPLSLTNSQISEGFTG